MARPVGAPNGFERVERALTSLAAVDSCDEQWQLDVLHGAQDRDQVVELEDESHAARAVVRALAIRHLGQRGSVDEDLAVVDRVEAGEAVEKGGLPAAARPHDGDHLAWLEDEVDTPERVDTDDTRVIGLAKGARLDDRNVHRDSPPSSLAASYDRACGGIGTPPRPRHGKVRTRDDATGAGYEVTTERVPAAVGPTPSRASLRIAVTKDVLRDCPRPDRREQRHEDPGRDRRS